MRIWQGSYNTPLTETDRQTDRQTDRERETETERERESMVIRYATICNNIIRNVIVNHRYTT